MRKRAIRSVDMPEWALADLERALQPHFDPDNDCDSCNGSVPGVLVPAGNDQNHLFVQSCDACRAGLPGDDVGAARLVAGRLGWRVRYRYDDRTLRYWRPFVARPGDWDDRDFACEGADEHGWEPVAEKPLCRLAPRPVRRAVHQALARQRKPA